jgi:hypothetical protein
MIQRDSLDRRGGVADVPRGGEEPAPYDWPPSRRQAGAVQLLSQGPTWDSKCYGDLLDGDLAFALLYAEPTRGDEVGGDSAL